MLKKAFTVAAAVAGLTLIGAPAFATTAQSAPSRDVLDTHLVSVDVLSHNQRQDGNGNINGSGNTGGNGNNVGNNNNGGNANSNGGNGNNVGAGNGGGGNGNVHWPFRALLG
ncbi:hypothetical protein F0L68_08575 [Solihabitans fulvus]|uniref:Uncharacterized protein n=1 Tax=Solihabitans fulvus TaxID=1892852 RepID=A0A5B2XLN7_9PSEU|nr:hypothetical protein [Solihabitans fulvus]KAA2264035.1 hypothetical protein F0L68_08575 [Solihabitans fulvus]